MPGRDSIIDNLSHAVIGSAVLALAPPGTHPAVAWGVLMGAEYPDIDFLLRFLGGPVTYLKHHRGPTHGLVVLPAASLLIALGLHLIWPAAPFWDLFLWTLAGALSHVIFDFLNDYGTQGLWPFSGRWIAMDIIPIIDLWLLGLIGAGWLVHWLWPGHRQAIFAGVWAALAAYVALRFWLRREAARLVRDRFDLEAPCGEAAPCGPGWRPQRLTIHPSLLSLNAWRYVVQAQGRYLTGMVWVRQGRVGEPVSARNDYDRVVLASLQSQVVSAFAGWARRPRVQVERKDCLYQVRWTEARYEVEGFSPFTAYAWLDDGLKLVDEGLGKQSLGQADREMLRRRLRMEMGRE